MRYVLEVDTNKQVGKRIEFMDGSLEKIDDITFLFNKRSLCIYLWKDGLVKCESWENIQDIRLRRIDENNDIKEELPVIYNDDFMFKDQFIDYYINFFFNNLDNLREFLLGIEGRQELIDKINLLISDPNINTMELEMLVIDLLNTYFDDYTILRRVYFELKNNNDYLDFIGYYGGKYTPNKAFFVTRKNRN